MTTQRVDGGWQIYYSFPGPTYVDTKANIEALAGVPQGAQAYATDYPSAPFGTYNGVTWDWLGAGGVAAETISPLLLIGA